MNRIIECFVEQIVHFGGIYEKFSIHWIFQLVTLKRMNTVVVGDVCTGIIIIIITIIMMIIRLKDEMSGYIFRRNYFPCWMLFSILLEHYYYCHWLSSGLFTDLYSSSFLMHLISFFPFNTVFSILFQSSHWIPLNKQI